METTITHRVRVSECDSYWECDCGSGGIGGINGADLSSDRHIRYDQGETRVDVSGGQE